MKTYSEQIDPGQPLRLAIGGRILYVLRSEGGSVLDVTFKQGGNTQTIERVGKSFKGAPVGGFEAIEIAASVAGVVEFVVTDGDMQIQFDEDAIKIGNDNSQAVPVRTAPGQPLEILFGGTVAPVLGVVTVDNTDAEAIPVQQKVGAVFTTQAEKLTVIVDHAAAVINTGAGQLLISDATYKRLRVKNASATARVALGGASMTMATAAIILEPGDTWIEDDAAGAAWYATSDTAAADVRVMGLK